MIRLPRRKPALLLAVAMGWYGLIASASAARTLRPKRAPRKEEPRQTALAAARRKVLNARPLALFYFSVTDPQSLEALRTHAAEITVFAPQAFWVEPDGVITGGVSPRALEICRQAHVPVMPLVFNKGFDRATVTKLLASTEAQRRAVTYMAYLAKRNHFVGFQIDLENIAPTDGARFTEFVRRAAARMHREGRLLSVAVVPRFDPATTGKGLRGTWSAAFDYRALGQAADFLTLMTYDHSGRSGPPGPIAGYEWVERALDYAVRRVPRRKLLMGIPLYGREWTDGAARARSLTRAEVRTLLARRDVHPRWDERWRSPWFEYQENGRKRTVWYEDKRSWAAKLELMRPYRLRGFAAWKLGMGGPDFWSLVAAHPKSPARRAVKRKRAAGKDGIR